MRKETSTMLYTVFIYPSITLFKYECGLYSPFYKIYLQELHNVTKIYNISPYLIFSLCEQRDKLLRKKIGCLSIYNSLKQVLCYG